MTRAIRSNTNTRAAPKKTRPARGRTARYFQGLSNHLPVAENIKSPEDTSPAEKQVPMSAPVRHCPHRIKNAPRDESPERDAE